MCPSVLIILKETLSNILKQSRNVYGLLNILNFVPKMSMDIAKFVLYQSMELVHKMQKL